MLLKKKRPKGASSNMPRKFSSVGVLRQDHSGGQTSDLGRRFERRRQHPQDRQHHDERAEGEDDVREAPLKTR